VVRSVTNLPWLHFRDVALEETFNRLRIVVPDIPPQQSSAITGTAQRCIAEADSSDQTRDPDTTCDLSHGRFLLANNLIWSNHNAAVCYKPRRDGHRLCPVARWTIYRSGRLNLGCRKTNSPDLTPFLFREMRSVDTWLLSI